MNMNLKEYRIYQKEVYPELVQLAYKKVWSELNHT